MPRRHAAPIAHADEADTQESTAPVFQVFSTVHTRREYDIYLSHELVEPSAYDELCQLLRGADPQDSVRLYLNTHGGDVASGLALIQAMQDSEATVTTILNPQAYSMGALLFLAGDVLVARPNGILMIHNYSSGLSGKGNEQAAEVAALNTWFEEVLRNVCHPFLTRAELKAVLHGRDLWLHYADIQKRLANMEKGN